MRAFPVLYALSYSFYFWVAKAPEPRVLPFVLFSVAQSAVWLWYFRERQRFSVPVLLAGALLSFALARAAMPLYENDFYRYFWDGEQVLRTGAPYALAPANAFLDGLEDVRTRISFPQYVTIYPPVAQLIFAFFAWVARHQLEGFLWSFIAASGIFFLFGMTRLLKREGQAGPWAIALLAVQHPLVVKEWFNSCHLDGWLAGMVVWGLAVLSPWVAMIWIGLGVNLKLATIPVVGSVKISARHLAWLSTVSFFPWICFWDGFLNFVETLRVFATLWEMNAGVFRWVRELTGEPLIARIFVAVGWAACAWFFYRRYHASRIEKIFWVMFFLIALSPVANAWYYTWSFPLAFCLPEARRALVLSLFTFVPLSYAFYLPSSFPIPVERWWDLEYVCMGGVLLLLCYRKKTSGVNVEVDVNLDAHSVRCES